MQETELFFHSTDSTSEIRALCWEPAGYPDACTDILCSLQILHGMGEHIERYRCFAEHCTRCGIVVFGHDQIGHGKSVASPEQLGHMPLGSTELLIDDAHRLRLMMQKRFQPREAKESLPHFMLGHSMGSFVLRLYLTHYFEGVSGAIISGTSHQPLLLSMGVLLLARILAASKGVAFKSPRLQDRFVGAYSKQIDNARTSLDWLSTDKRVVDEYIASPECGFLVDAGTVHSIAGLTSSMVRRKAAAAVPSSLPLLFISGAEDPIGEKGAAVKRAVQLFKSTGHSDVTLVLYEAMRHETLNELGKEQVYNDIEKWLKKQLVARIGRRL